MLRWFDLAPLLRYLWPRMRNFVIVTFFILSTFAYTGPLTPAQIQQALQEKNVRILIVPGFAPREGSLMDRSAYHPDFEALVELLQHLGYEAVVSKIWKGGSVDTAFPTLINEIKNSKKLVLIIGHSMGGIKSLEALRRSIEAQNNTAGLMLALCPIRGCVASEIMGSFPEGPVVDWNESTIELLRGVQQGILHLMDPMGLRKTVPLFERMENTWYELARAGVNGYRDFMQTRAQVLFEWLWEGDPKVLADISTKHRRWYMETYKNHFRQMGIPMLTVRGVGGHDSPFYQFLIPRGKNDGLLLLEEQKLPAGMGFGDRVLDVNHLALFTQPWEHLSHWQNCLMEITGLAPVGRIQY